jgi:hypothetical protein
MENPTNNRNPFYLAAIAMCAVAPILVVLWWTSSAEPEQAAANVSFPSLAAEPVATLATTAPTTNAVATVEPPTATLPATQPVPVAPTSAPTAPAANPKVLNTAMAEAVVRAVRLRMYECSPITGGGFADIPFEDVAPNGVLIGLRLGMGKFMNYDVFKFVQPIYLTPQGQKYGQGFGRATGNIFEAKAPAGYAIGAVRVCGGGGFDSLSIDYMPIVDSHLNPYQIVRTNRVGTKGIIENTLSGDGIPIIGICGRHDKKGEWLGFGVVYLQPKPKDR